MWYPTLDLEMAALFAARIDGTLTSLTLGTSSVPLLRMLLTKSGRLLTRLSMSCSACPLALIASTCPHLVSLALSGCGLKKLKEDGFSALSDLTLGWCDVSAKESEDLLSMVAQHLRLRLLKLMGTFNEEEDAGWFCQ